MYLKGKRILVIGASSDLAADLDRMLVESGAIIGLHYNKNHEALLSYKDSRVTRKLKKNLNNSKACYDIIDEFVKWARGIDCLVQLSGDIKKPVHWSGLMKKDWDYDMDNNLVIPFFLTQRAVYHMKKQGGRIILMSTASASHGGGATSLAYGIAKAGIECMVKGLARDCAKYNILINAVAPGFINTKFHTEKMHKTKEQLEERIRLIPLKRAGTTKEFAETVMFLLSEGASYITGQTIAISGGDWL